jgi:hypothetical protein
MERLLSDRSIRGGPVHSRFDGARHAHRLHGAKTFRPPVVSRSVRRRGPPVAAIVDRPVEPFEWDRAAPKWAATVVAVAGLIVLGVVADVRYTGAPDMLAGIIAGGLLSLPFLAWVQLRFAAVVAAAAEVAIVGHDLRYPAQALFVVHLAVVVLAVGSAVLAWRVGARPVRQSTTGQVVRAGMVFTAGIVLVALAAYWPPALLGPATFVLLVGAGAVWRLRDAAATPQPARSPTRSPARRDGRREWPELGPEVLLVFVLPVLGAVTAKPDLRWLVHVVCGTGDCPPLPMAVIGWSVFAVPLFAVAAIYALAKPTELASWGLVVAVGPLLFGSAVVLFAEDQVPEAYAVKIGFVCGWAALLLFGPLAPAMKSGKLTPLLAITGGQLAALPLATWLSR